MYTVKCDITSLEERFAGMKERFENFPSDMEVEMNLWQMQDAARQQPETERYGNSVASTIDANPRGARKNLGSRGGRGGGGAFGSQPINPNQRVLERYMRRMMWRMMPRPVRMLRRYGSIGRRAMRRPESFFMPPPIRRLRRFQRQFKAVAAGRRAAVLRHVPFAGPIFRKVFRLQRRQRRQKELSDALTGRLVRRARKKLNWKKKVDPVSDQ